MGCGAFTKVVIKVHAAPQEAEYSSQSSHLSSHSVTSNVSKNFEATFDVRPSMNVRMSFNGILISEPNSEAPFGSSTHGSATSVPSAESMVLITDLGQDNDDEMALLLLSELARRGDAKVLGVVANLRPANRRAALARGTLDMLGMVDVPVGIGTDGGSDRHTDTFSQYISKEMTGVDYFTASWQAVMKLEQAMGTKEEEALSSQLRVYDGEKLLFRVLENAEDDSLNLVLISSLKDAGMLLRDHEDLFRAKVKCVTIMGGAKISEPGENTCTSLEPTDAHNNVFDFPAAKFFYQRCQELGVPLIVLSRFTSYGCPVQKKVYDLMVRCPVPHPTVCRLQQAQRSSIETLWQSVCAGGKLPARCDKQWFCDTFCGGEGADRAENDSMWDLVKTFNMYDPLAILASLPKTRNLFFKPTRHMAPDWTVHLSIGESQNNCGIVESRLDELHDFMMSHWMRAAGRSWYGESFAGSVERPLHLQQEQLTASLTPMKTHTSEELRNLSVNVLRLIDEEWPKLKNSSLLNTWRNRDDLIKSIGPAMALVDPATILEFGRIPHSDENKTISMEIAAERAEHDNKRFFIEMFSHRWHSRFAPDDRDNSKAKVLCEWAEYRKSMNFRTFFWIDYACINQSDIAPGVTMLPLYVSCCNNILCYDTPHYELRAWCRIERLLFTAFVAPNNEFIGPDFEYKHYEEKLKSGEIRPSYDGKMFVPDPIGTDAELSYPADKELISELKELCTQHWGKCWKDGLMDIVEEKVGLKEVRSLQYASNGGTEIRLRKFL